MKLLPSRRPDKNGFLQLAGLAVSVGSSLLGGASARRAAEKQRAEARRREAQTTETATQAASAVTAAGRAAAAPLRREAGLLRDADEFRDPLLEQSLLDSVRQEAGQAVDRTSVSRNPAAARAGVVNALFQSRGLMARESARIARTANLRTTRASLLTSAGEFDVRSASEAARLRVQGAGINAGLPITPEAPNTIAALGGGLVSSLDQMTDEQRQSVEDQLAGLFGGGPSADPSLPTTVTARTNSQHNALGLAGPIPDDIALVPDDFLERFTQGIKTTFTF